MQSKKELIKKQVQNINYLDQYALFLSKSFSIDSENIFSSKEISALEDRLHIDSDLRFYTGGMFEETKTGINFVSNAILQIEGKKTFRVFPLEEMRTLWLCSCLVFAWIYRKSYNYWEIKEIPKGLYSITYDPVGVDKEKNEITNKYSHISISVWTNPHAINGFKAKKVAAYYGRPDRLEEADRICYHLSIYYN